VVALELGSLHSGVESSAAGRPVEVVVPALHSPADDIVRHYFPDDVDTADAAEAVCVDCCHPQSHSRHSEKPQYQIPYTPFALPKINNKCLNK
jgi:hypothetical protein